MNTALIQDGYMLAIVPPVLRAEYLAAIRLYQQKGDAEMKCLGSQSFMVDKM